MSLVRGRCRWVLLFACLACTQSLFDSHVGEADGGPGGGDGGGGDGGGDG